MKVSLKRGFDYVPVWNDNRDLPEKEQIVVHFKFLTGSDIRECQDTSGNYDEEKEWSIICEKIDNLEDDEGEVSSLDVLRKEGFAGLWLELKSAYRQETVFNKKK